MIRHFRKLVTHFHVLRGIKLRIVVNSCRLDHRQILAYYELTLRRRFETATAHSPLGRGKGWVDTPPTFPHPQPLPRGEFSVRLRNVSHELAFAPKKPHDFPTRRLSNNVWRNCQAYWRMFFSTCSYLVKIKLDGSSAPCIRLVKKRIQKYQHSARRIASCKQPCH